MDSTTTPPKDEYLEANNHVRTDNPPTFFNYFLQKHIAICPDVVLEQTIVIRDVLRRHPPAIEQLWVYTTLDVVLPLRPLTCPTLEQGQSHPVVLWSDFVATDGPKPLELILMQAECLQLPTAKALFEQHQHALKLGQGFDVTLDGTAIDTQPFKGFDQRVDKLLMLTLRLTEAEYVGGAQVIRCLQTICVHYHDFSKLVCDYGRTSPTHYSFDDLWAKPECHQINGSYRYLGGNATLGGTGVRYSRVCQTLVGKLTQQDDWGHQAKATRGGTHPTFTNNEMPLFFKATKFNDENSLGTTKEHAMYVLAEKLFQRGVAPTALITINRHVTIDLGVNKREHPLFKLDLFRLRPDMFQNHDDLIVEFQLEYSVVKREQMMRIPRLVQVAEKVYGKELGEVLNSTPDALDSKSLSETVLYTLLTCADDAKGDNFFVREDGVIVGIDNDHVLGLPTMTSREGFTVVKLKNVLLCDPAILAMPVHADVVSLLRTFEFDAMLVEWLRDMLSYGEEVDRLEVQGALPNSWVSTNLGQDDDHGAAGRMSRYWCVLKTLTMTKETVTHGDLFLALFPSVATFYSLITDHVKLNATNSDASTIRREVMRYLYYQAEPISLQEKEELPPLYMKDELTDKNYVAPTGDFSFVLPSPKPTIPENVCGQLVQLLQAAELSHPPSFRTLINTLACQPGVFGLHEWIDAFPEDWKSENVLCILLRSGETNVAILNSVFQFSHQELSAEILVDAAIQRILSTPTLATHSQTFDEQCRWLLEKNIFLDSSTKKDSLLVKVVAAFLRTNTCFELLGLFVILVKYGARELSSISLVTKFWNQLGGLAGVCHRDSARVAIDTLAQTNLKLQWQLLLSQLISQTASTSTSDLQCSGLGLCNIPPLILSQLLNSDGEVIRANRFGRRTVGRMEIPSFGDVYVKVWPELPGVEFMVRELHRTLFGRDAAPFTELVRWNRSDTAGIPFNAPVLLSQAVDGKTLHEVLTESDDHGEYVLQNLEPRSLSRMIFMAILTMPEDGKPDNYICKLGASGMYELVCIDNDHAFAPPAVKDNKKQRHLHLRVKCVLFCLDQMKVEIDPQIQQVLCDSELNVIEGVYTWLKSLKKHSARTEALFHNVKHTNTDSALGMPIPSGATRLLCEKLRKARGFLGKNPNATHLELLLTLEPLLERRYRDALDKHEHVWERFKDVDGEGFLLIDGRHTTMFNTTQMMQSVLQRNVNLNTIMRIQNRLEMSPTQALHELHKVEKEWDDLSKDTLLVINGTVPTTSVEGILSLTSVPIDVIERVLDECDFSDVAVRVQQNFLQLLAMRQEHICKLVLCGFAVSKRALFVRLVGCNLTKLKLVNCSGVDVGGDTMFNCSALATIADTCDALKSLEIVGHEQLSKIGSRTTPLRFSSLIVLRVERCSVLSSIGVTFDRNSGSGGKLFISECPILAQPFVSGKIASRSWRWDEEGPEAFIKLVVPTEHCALFATPTVTSLQFANRPVNTEDIQWIMTGLSIATWIVSLHIVNSDVGDEEATKIAQALKISTTLTILDLSSNKIGSKGTSAIAKALPMNTTLTTLVLSWNNVGDGGVISIAEALKVNTSLTTLILYGYKIEDTVDTPLTTFDQIDVGDDGAIALAQALTMNTTLATIKLCGNRIGYTGTTAIAELLKMNAGLTSLDLSWNNVGNEGAKKLVEALKINTTLIKLDLRHTNVGEEWTAVIAQVLKLNDTLTTLGIRRTTVGVAETNLTTLDLCGKGFGKRIGDVWASKIATMLKIKTTLTTLNLGSNNIGSEGAIALAHALKINTTLTTLILSNNKIGDEGTSAIAEALEMNTTLTRLYLSRNEIGDTETCAIAEALKINTTLTILDLSWNYVGVKGAPKLAEALKTNTALKTLSLGYNNVGSTGAIALAQAFEINTTLTTLDLGRNWIKDEGVISIAEALEVNTALTTLILGHTEIESKGIFAIAEALQMNRTLTTLDLSDNAVGSEGASKLVEAFKINTTLMKLNLHNTGVGEPWLCMIADALKINTTLTMLGIRRIAVGVAETNLTTIDLSNKEVGDVGGSKIATELKTNTTLTTLNLTSCKICGGGAIALAHALKHNTTLTTLILCGNRIGDIGTSAIAEALTMNTTLTTLDLSRNTVGHQGASKLAKALKFNTTLTTLVLSRNTVGHKRASKLAKASTLIKLNLTFCKIGSEGAIALAHVLKFNNTLTTLILSGNKIGNEGTSAIAEALKSNTALTVLSLSVNEIEDEGTSAIAEALKMNKTLTTLVLNYNHVGNEGARKLVEALKLNVTLIKLELTLCKIESEGAIAFAHALQINTTLTTLILNNNNVGDEGVTLIAAALTINKTLTVFDLSYNRRLTSKSKQQLKDVWKDRGVLTL